MDKILKESDLHPDGFTCDGGKLKPVVVSPAFNCNDLNSCNINALGNVTAAAPTSGQVLIYDGSNWVASNILTGSGGGVYSQDFLIADWSGSPLTITILATTHGLGITPDLHVEIYEDNGVQNDSIITDYSVSDTGDVTIETNTAFNGRVVLIGSAAGIVSNKMVYAMRSALGFSYGNYIGPTADIDSASELAVEVEFDLINTATISSIRVIYDDNTALSNIDGDSIITLRKNNADTGIAINIPQPTNTGRKLQAASNVGTETFTPSDIMSFSLTGSATTGDIYLRALIIDYII